MLPSPTNISLHSFLPRKQAHVASLPLGDSSNTTYTFQADDNCLQSADLKELINKVRPLNSPYSFLLSLVLMLLIQRFLRTVVPNSCLCVSGVADVSPWM